MKPFNRLFRGKVQSLLQFESLKRRLKSEGIPFTSEKTSVGRLLYQKIVLGGSDIAISPNNVPGELTVFINEQKSQNAKTPEDIGKEKGNSYKNSNALFDKEIGKRNEKI